MTPEELVSELRSTVFNPAVEVRSLRPTGRRPHELLVRLSGWYDALAEDEQRCVRQAMRLTGYTTMFGILSVLDGSRAIDHPPHGQLRLTYVGPDGSETLLNDAPTADLVSLWTNEVFPYTDDPSTI